MAVWITNHTFDGYSNSPSALIGYAKEIRRVRTEKRNRLYKFLFFIFLTLLTLLLENILGGLLQLLVCLLGIIAFFFLFMAWFPHRDVQPFIVQHVAEKLDIKYETCYKDIDYCLNLYLFWGGIWWFVVNGEQRKLFKEYLATLRCLQLPNAIILSGLGKTA